MLQTRERLFRAPARLRLAHGELEDHEGDRAADQQGRQRRHQRPSPQRRKRRERQRPFAAAEAQPLGGDQGFAARRAEAAVVEQPRRLRLRTVVDAEFEQWLGLASEDGDEQVVRAEGRVHPTDERFAARLQTLGNLAAAVDGHIDDEADLAAGVDLLHQRDLAGDGGARLIPRALHRFAPDGVGEHVVTHRGAVALILWLQHDHGGAFLERGVRPHAQPRESARSQPGLDRLRILLAEALREPDPLHAGVPLLELEAPCVSVEFLRRQVGAGSEEPGAAAEHALVRVQARFDPIDGGADGVGKPSAVSHPYAHENEHRGRQCERNRARQCGPRCDGSAHAGSLQTAERAGKPPGSW